LEGTAQQGRGFRVFTLAESNFKPWAADAPHSLSRGLASLSCKQTTSAKTARPKTCFMRVESKSGFPFVPPVDKLSLAGKDVNSVAGNDQLKANAVQILKTKGGTIFKTV
jgi:adenine-specific DNA-methyltransferase